MNTHYHAWNEIAVGARVRSTHPVNVDVVPALTHRNRLTCAFRLLLAIPHLVLGAGLGAAAAASAYVAWFAMLLGASYPDIPYRLTVYYLRWRVRAAAYASLLRDEYPPFGDSLYSAWLVLRPPPVERNRLAVAFRLVLVMPYLLAASLIGAAWVLSTLALLIAILATGRCPDGLYQFGVSVLRWTTRVQAYVLLLHDDPPPFSLDR